MEQSHPDPTTDTSLAHAWEAGDETGFNALVHRYGPMVLARCQRALGATDAEDATQAVFLVLARRAEQAAASPVLAAWLHKVTEMVIRNAVRDRARRRQAERMLPPPALTTEEPTMPDTITDHLDACLAKLPAVERDLVRLHYLAGHSLSQVAEHTKTPVSTVKYRLANSLTRLRGLLGKRGVVVGQVALVGFLTSEARAELPAAFAGQLRALDPALTSTATPPLAERIHHWARPARSFMTRFALAGAACLLLGGLLIHHQSTTVVASEAVTESTPPTPVTSPDYTTIDFAIPDLPATLNHIRKLPEYGILANKDLESYVVRFSCFKALYAKMLNNSEGEKNIAASKDFPWLSNFLLQLPFLPQATTVERAQNFLSGFKVTDEKNYLTENGEIQGIEIRHSGDLPLPKVLGPLAPATPPYDVIFQLYKMKGSTKDWSQTAQLSFSQQSIDGEISIQNSRSAGSTPPVAEYVDLQSFRAVPQNALCAALFPLRQGTVFAESIKYLEDSNPEKPLVNGIGKALAQRFAETLFPYSMFYDGQHPQLGLRLWIDPSSKSSPLLRLRLLALSKTLNSIDGDRAVWLQPGNPLPAMGIDVPLAMPPTALAEAAGQPDPTKPFAFQLNGSDGTFMLSFQWRAGHMRYTCDPNGLSILGAPGEFTAWPEVQGALRNMPHQEQNKIAIIFRSGPCFDLAAPFLSMLTIDKDGAEKMRSYGDYLHQSTNSSWLVFSDNDTGSHAQAHGLLGLFASVALIGLSQNPVSLFNGTN